MQNQNLEKLELEIFNAISECRHKVLDICEIELGQSQRWVLFRKQILKYFGNRGLESEVKRLFELNRSINQNGGFCA